MSTISLSYCDRSGAVDIVLDGGKLLALCWVVTLDMWLKLRVWGDARKYRGSDCLAAYDASLWRGLLMGREIRYLVTESATDFNMINCCLVDGL